MTVSKYSLSRISPLNGSGISVSVSFISVVCALLRSYIYIALHNFILDMLDFGRWKEKKIRKLPSYRYHCVERTRPKAPFTAKVTTFVIKPGALGFCVGVSDSYLNVMQIQHAECSHNCKHKFIFLIIMMLLTFFFLIDHESYFASGLLTCVWGLGFNSMVDIDYCKLYCSLVVNDPSPNPERAIHDH